YRVRRRCLPRTDGANKLLRRQGLARKYGAWPPSRLCEQARNRDVSASSVLLAGRGPSGRRERSEFLPCFFSVPPCLRGEMLIPAIIIDSETPLPFKRPKPTLDEAALYDYAIGALGRKMRTVAELKRLLRNRVPRDEAGEILVEMIILRLKEQKYLNDSNYAATYSAFRRDNEKFGP